MLDPVTLFRDGGPFMYLLLLGLPLGLMVSLAAFAASLFKVRVPLLVWAAPASAFATVGLFGTAYGLGLSLQATAYASVEMKSTLAAAGHAVAAYTAIVGWLGASLLCVAATWASALGHLRAGEDDEWDFGTTAAVGLGGLVFGAIVAGLGYSQGGLFVSFVGLVTMASGLGMAPVALRASEEPASRARLAEGRVVTATLALGGPVAMALALATAGRSQAMEATAVGGATLREVFLASGEETASAAYTTGAAGVAVLLLLGLVMALPRARYVPGLRLALHVVGAVLLLVPVIGTGAFASMRSAAVTEVVRLSFAARPTDDLQAPSRPSGRAPSHRRVDVTLSRRTVEAGATTIHLQEAIDPSTGAVRTALPSDFATEAKALAEALGSRELDGVVVLQADYRTPVDVLGPVVDVLAKQGRIELVVYTSEGEAVVDLPEVPAQHPFATVDQLLGNAPVDTRTVEPPEAEAEE